MHLLLRLPPTCGVRGHLSSPLLSPAGPRSTEAAGGHGDPQFTCTFWPQLLLEPEAERLPSGLSLYSHWHAFYWQNLKGSRWKRVWGTHCLGIQTLKCRGEHKREGEQTEREQTLSPRINIHTRYHSSTRKQAVILVQKDELCLPLPLNLKKCHNRHKGTENKKGICDMNSMCQLHWATRYPDI